MTCFGLHPEAFEMASIQLRAARVRTDAIGSRWTLAQRTSLEVMTDWFHVLRVVLLVVLSNFGQHLVDAPF